MRDDRNYFSVQPESSYACNPAQLSAGNQLYNQVTGTNTAREGEEPSSSENATLFPSRDATMKKIF